MAFRVGQKVTPINADPWRNSVCPTIVYPRFGVVYTIRAIDHEYDGLYLRFAEIVNASFQFLDEFGEPNFDAAEFRPIVERKTDISIFTAMLTPSKKTIDAMNRESV